MRPLPRSHAILAALATLIGACYVNDMEESAGNGARQDSGLHVTIEGNFILNVDGSRVVTTALLADRDGASATHLVGLEVPGLDALVGPSLDGASGLRVMQTPDPDRAWLVTTRAGRLDVAPLALDAMTLGRSLTLPDIGVDGFNAANLANDGRTLAVARVWAADALHKVLLGDVDGGALRGAWHDLDVTGALFDLRFTGDGQRVVTLSVPVDGAGHFTASAILAVHDLLAPGVPGEARVVTLDGFHLNLLGVLTWAIRLSPDGRLAAVSGRDDAGAGVTHVVDLDTGALFGSYPCEGPVGFGPDGATMVGFEREDDGRSSALVVTDLASGVSETTPYGFANPVYWLSPSGKRVVVYPFAGSGLVVTDLDTLESSAVGGGDGVALTEFAVSPDGDFVYLVYDGGLWLLDLETAEVSALAPTTRGYDNINILPGGDTLVLSRDGTTRFELFDLVSASVVAGATLPTRL
ncbi:MAG: hypothetical protein KC635_29650 [Myxococcales bacterium]|nr:hypothetical protein [Myxococcales bacterium]MCB9732084.1 hypothetical protein [Deltaproteobacteria bacterium]